MTKMEKDMQILGQLYSGLHLSEQELERAEMLLYIMGEQIKARKK